MKRMGTALAFVAVLVTGIVSATVPAYAVQEVTLKEYPPLEPLHYCKYADGHVAYQREACGSDTTEVSSVMERQRDGRMEHLPLGSKEAADLTGKTAASDPAAKDIANADADVPKSPLRDFWKRMGKWMLFALAVAIVARLLKQSFFLWLILGFVLRMLLVAANVMAF